MARILALTSRVPWPPREGHQLRSWHILDALAHHHQVHLLSCLRPDDEPQADSPLRDRLAGFETFPIPAERSRVALARALALGTATATPFVAAKYAIPALRRRVSELAPTSDLVHVDMLPLMATLPAALRHKPTVLNAHNVEHALLAARAGVEHRPAVRLFLRTQVPRLQRFELDACRRVGAVLACSEDDAGQLRQLAPGTRVQVVPNGVDLDYNRPSGTRPDPACMVFVGQMGWFPNRDGVEWFLAEVFPRILARRPGARFVIIGKPGDLTVPAPLRGNVKLAGFVPDVRAPVRSAGIYVVPLRAGSGTRLKVLEAMALGKAIVTTRTGAEGITLEPGHDAVFADDAGSFADAVVRLMDDPGEVARLGHAARAAAEQHYGWRAIGAAMLPVYSRLLA